MIDEELRKTEMEVYVEADVSDYDDVISAAGLVIFMLGDFVDKWQDEIYKKYDINTGDIDEDYQLALEKAAEDLSALIDEFYKDVNEFIDDWYGMDEFVNDNGYVYTKEDAMEDAGDEEFERRRDFGWD